jgi:transposase
VPLTRRYYGISRTVFYRWLRRYQAEGLAGLRDRSRRPAHRRTRPRPRSS